MRYKPNALKYTKQETEVAMYNILLVDSSDEMLKKMIELDSPAIQNVYLAGNIKDLEKYIKDGSVDIIVSDLYLNNVELMPFFERLRSSSHNLPIIIITADQSRDNVLKAASIGTMGYYLKPIEETTLVSKIQTALDVYHDHHPSRNYVRIKPHVSDVIELYYKVPDSQTRFEGKLIDISLGGLAFIRQANDFSAEIRKDGVIDIELTIDNSLLKLKSLVVNIMDMRCNAQFVDLSRSCQEILSTYIYKRIGVQ